MNRTFSLPLGALASGYLFLPLAIFVGAWLRSGFALVFLALLVATAWAMRRELAEVVPVSRKLLLGAAIVALAWTALSGAGGFGHQNPDWGKHESVLHALVHEDWPVFYEGAVPGIGGERHGLVFYLAYYLPAGAVGKLFGWKAANWALAAWTALGLALTLLVFARLVDSTRARFLALPLFVFASGLDALAYWLHHRAAFPLTLHIEWWSGLWQYSSNTSLLFWVPHQALGGWLATALLLDGIVRPGGSRAAPLHLAGALFWSPFAALGGLPFALLAVARSPRPSLRFWPNWLTAPALGALLVVYYAALRQERLPGAFDGSLVGARAPVFLLFLALEVGVVLVLAWPRREENAPLRAIAFLIGISLALIPFCRLGQFNDFAMRVSIPALFALWVLAGRALVDATRPATRRLALAIALLVGAVTPIAEMARSVASYRVGVPPAASIAPLPYVHPEPELALQYLGPPDALFFRLLAERPTEATTPGRSR